MCKTEEKYEWVINRLGWIASRKYKDKCLSAKEDFHITRIETYGYVTVSSTISDTNANPYSVVDPNGAGWWSVPIDA